MHLVWTSKSSGPGVGIGVDVVEMWIRTRRSVIGRYSDPGCPSADCDKVARPSSPSAVEHELCRYVSDCVYTGREKESCQKSEGEESRWTRLVEVTRLTFDEKSVRRVSEYSGAHIYGSGHVCMRHIRACGPISQGPPSHRQYKAHLYPRAHCTRPKAFWHHCFPY